MQKNINYSIAELLDKLSIMQIKQIKNLHQYKKYQVTINKILSDLNTFLKENKIYLNSNIIRLLISLAQINYYIWRIRENNQKNNLKNKQLVKLSHQLNAIRNLIKNKLLKRLSKNKKNLQTNVNKEDLKNWKFSITNER